MTEGRKALAIRLAGIEGGIECAKLASRLSALADGEARAEQLRVLRPHLKTCLSCRARLKEFRAAPARVAALIPPVAVVVATSGGSAGLLPSLLGGARQKAESMLGAAQQKAAVLGERAHAAVELATGQKVAAVAASAAALAGGGTAVDQLASREPPRPPPTEQSAEAKPVKEEVAVDPAPAPAPVSEQPAAPEPAPTPAPAPEPAPAPPPPPPPPPDPATEFDPAVAAAPAPPPAAPPPSQPAANGFPFAGAGGSATGSGTAGGNEFGP